MRLTIKALMTLFCALISLAVLPIHPSAAQQTGPVFTLDRDSGYLTVSPQINQAVTISVTRAGSVIENASTASSFYRYQFTTPLQPGDQITVKAGATVLYDTEVIPVNLTVDMANSQIRGQAFPGQVVKANFHTWTSPSTNARNNCLGKGGYDYPYSLYVETTAAPDGSFTLTNPVGIRAGDTGYLYISDALGNRQLLDFNTGDTIAINVQRRTLEGHFFSSVPKLSSLTVTIRQPDGTLLWSTSTDYINNPDNSQFSRVIPETVPLLPGEVIQVTDGVKTKQMIIPSITLDRLSGSRAITGRVEIPGSDTTPSGWLVSEWDKFRPLTFFTALCQEGPLNQGMINVSFGDQPFAALDTIYLTYADGMGDYITSDYTMNALAVIKDQPVPNYGVFDILLENRGQVFTLDHYRAGQVIGSYSDFTDARGDGTIRTAPEVIALTGDRVVVSEGGEILIDVIVPQLSGVVDPLKNQITGLVTSQAPNPVLMNAHLTRVNGAKQTIQKWIAFDSNVDGTFTAQPQAGETWGASYEEPGRVFQIDACTQLDRLFSQAPGGHIITWFGPTPANVSADAFEPDSTAQTARPYTGPQRHTLLTGSDEDWVSFEITAADVGIPLTFTTQAMGWFMPVDLTLYQDSKALTSTTLTEPSTQSIAYTFNTPGVYLAQIKARTSTGYTFGGCDSAYTLAITPPANTVTELASAPQRPVSGQPVVLTARVAPEAPNVKTPTGTVTFYDGASPLGSPVSLVAGAARLDLPGLPVGTHTLTARYEGDNHFAASESPAVELVIEPEIHAIFLPAVVQR